MNTTTRRQFIERTLLGSLGVSLIPTPSFSAQPSKQKAEHVIYLYFAGGMSHLDTFDPKNDPDTKGEFKAINTKVDGIQICEHLSGLAKHADKMSIVRGMTVTTGDHAGAQYYARTSFKKIGTIVHPAMGAWMCSTFDDHKPHSVPSNILINGPADHPGSGWMPKRYSPVPINDPLRGLDNTIIKNKDAFNKRIAILDQLNHDSNKINNPAIKGYSEFYDQTIKLLNSSDLDVFDLNKESKETREKYGNNRFGQGLCLAKRLIEKSGAKFIEVTHGGWDMHTNIASSMEAQLNVVDTALTTLIDDLTSSGLFNKTLIVIATDFGRGPYNINAGRDHNPAAFSQVLIGAGIKGGTIYGQTSKKGTSVEDKQTSVQDFNATIASVIGIDTDQKIISPEGRPFSVADKGKPIGDILK